MTGSFRIIAIPELLQNQIKSHCEMKYPEEACGVLMGNGDGVTSAWDLHTVWEAPNFHIGDKKNRYVIPPEIQLQAEKYANKNGTQVLGYYHSHPDHPAIPSEFDRQQAWFGYLYLICSVRNAKAVELRAYTLDQVDGKFHTIT